MMPNIEHIHPKIRKQSRFEQRSRSELDSDFSLKDPRRSQEELLQSIVLSDFSAMSYEEVTTESWGSRLRSSLGTVLGAGAVVLISIGGLVWNESNLVSMRKALDESESLVQELPSIAEVDSKYEDRLVHLTGLVTTPSSVEDAIFGVSLSNTLKLKRSVEMYQWSESKHVKTKKKTGGSTEKTTTYSYDKKWLHYVENSDQFNRAGYENPESIPFQDLVDVADPISLGIFTLPEEVYNKIHGFEVLSPPPSLTNIPESTKNTTAKITIYEDQGFYIGEGDSSNPIVGDVRVTFSQIPSKNITIVARQTGNSFGEYTTSNDREILLVEDGKLSTNEMFDKANSEMTTLAWIIRLVAFGAMWMAFAAMAEPLVVFADVLPILGSCVGGIVQVVSGLLAFLVSLVTIALAWLFFRPLFSLALFGIAAAVAIGLSMLRGRKKDQGYEEVKQDAEIV